MLKDLCAPEEEAKRQALVRRCDVVFDGALLVDRRVGILDVMIWLVSC